MLELKGKIQELLMRKIQELLCRPERSRGRHIDIVRMFFFLSRLFLGDGWDNLPETFLKGPSLVVVVQ